MIFSIINYYNFYMVLIFVPDVINETFLFWCDQCIMMSVRSLFLRSIVKVPLSWLHKHLKWML